MGTKRSDDAGSVHMLEVIVIASIMISAATFVATFEAPPKGAAPNREILQQQATDALSILYETKISGSEYGDNALSVYLASCLQGNCSDLERKLDKLLPSGASYALYVSNGVSTYPVLVTREPAGEAVTATQLIEPRWSNSFVSTGTDLVDPTKEPLLVYSLPIFNSNPVSEGGSPLLVLVHGTRLNDGSDYTLTAFYTTRAADVADITKVPAASFRFVDASGAALPVFDARATTLAAGNPSGTPVEFRLRLTEEANVAIPAVTNVTVQMPRGWTAVANASANPGWNVVANATDKGGNATGGDIRANLLAPLKNATLDFVFEATYHGDLLDYYPIRALLTRGAASTATMIVRADDQQGGATFDAPAVHMSLPRPMGAAATTQWTLGAVVPKGNGSLENLLSIDRIEIIEQDGAAIFGDVQGINSMGGTWTNGGDRLIWEGVQLLTHDTPLNLTFAVTASGKAGDTTTRTTFQPPVTFDSGTGRLLHQSAPGLFRSPVLPANGGMTGYNTAGLQSHPVRSDAIYRTTPLPGGSTYDAGLKVAIEDALYGSYVNVERRQAPAGGTVVMTADIQSLLFALAEAGQSAGVHVNFYPPWTGDEHKPIWTQKNLDKGLFSSDVTQMVLHDLNKDGFPDPIVGTSNGRVFGIHALTGARFQGNVYTAPLRATENIATTASILQMATIQWDGSTYIVLGTDSASTGIIVLDETFQVTHTFDLAARDVISMDTTTDLTGDGRPDILVAVEAAGNSAVFILSKEDGAQSLKAKLPAIPVTGVDGAFYRSTGVADALLGISDLGPHRKDGFAVTVQTIVDVDITVAPDTKTPQNSKFSMVHSLPRVGLDAVDSDGNKLYTFFGSPVTKAVPYAYDGDGTDILAGGPGGFVFMLNGTVATQPIYSLLLLGGQQIIDSSTPNPLESYVLTEDGSIIYTDDAWVTIYCINCEPITQTAITIPTARSIASNGTASIWLAGSANTLSRSVVSDTSFEVPQAPMIKHTLMFPALPNGELDGPKASIYFLQKGLVQPTSFANRLHDFTDVHFGTGATADSGWVIGTACLDLALLCPEALVMRTSNGGADWIINSFDDPDNHMETALGAPVTSTLNRIFFTETGVGWIVGNSGTVLRSLDGGVSWLGVPFPSTANLNDIDCLKSDPSRCFIVGANGVAYATTNGLADRASVNWTVLPVSQFAPGKNLRTIGFQNDGTGYIGSDNAVLKTYDGGTSWTTLPLNYVENTGYSVDVFPDGSGYVYGGGPGNGRIWFLADYPLESLARTVSLTPDLPDDAHIVQVKLKHSNVSISTGAAHAIVFASTNGSDWFPMGSFQPPDQDDLEELEAESRNWGLGTAVFDSSMSGKDLAIEIRLLTQGDKTLYTPIIRELEFEVVYETPLGYEVVNVPIDFGSTAQKDEANTTAQWRTDLRALYQPIVDEYWVRNVSGEVLDIQTGFDLTGDGRSEAWVSTGNILSLNSPDYFIYANGEKARVISPDNRVYVLDGKNGTILAMTPSLDGSVTHLRFAPTLPASADDDVQGEEDDGDTAPEVPGYLFATTSNLQTGKSRLYALHPLTLDVIWRIDLDGPANDLEAIIGPDSTPVAFAATRSDTKSMVEGNGRVWGLAAQTGTTLWKAIPDDRGKYIVSKDIPNSWLFGPYVVEVEVSWEDGTGADGLPLLRSARVYDYFEVTPPDSLSLPSPVYDVHLVTWFDDWR